ncbi:MAG: hypothetical protein QXF25_03290 [Candidatus Pacearchaeota archaeon]
MFEGFSGNETFNFCCLNSTLPRIVYKNYFPNINFSLPNDLLNVYSCRLFEENPKIIGLDFIHITKYLLSTQENKKISENEKKEVLELKSLEDEKFRVILPSSLEEVFAPKFLIDPERGNVLTCNFSKYRLVLKDNLFYPCYTKIILSKEGTRKKNNVGKTFFNCSDCACIYENDMLANLESKIKKYKNPLFALDYKENGR